MENLTFAAIAFFILAFGAISARIERSLLTAPMMFVAFGWLMGPSGFGLIDLETEHPLIHLFAEITLVMVLFTDAARIRLDKLRQQHRIPVRLLVFGLPLTMLLGGLAAVGLFPEFSLAEAMILAVILAPTDAALGQAVVSSPSVPLRIRQALNVESGLNDGLALPILLFFVCMASTGVHDNSPWSWLKSAGLQLSLGPIVGLFIGYSGGLLVLWATRKRWMSSSFQELASLALALLAFSLAEIIGGNGFLAAFCAGLTLGNTIKGLCHGLYEFAEAEGQLLTLVTFLFFGAVLVPHALIEVNLPVIIYAVLSLTLVRILPVWISLLGLKLKRSTNLFLGWFGPRGVASILYGLLVLEDMGIGAAGKLFQITVFTVLLSVVAHGMSAWPGVKAYSRRLGDMENNAPEHHPVVELPLRLKTESAPADSAQ